ncbi:uncharacterized protein LOC119679861 isoform X2 [Teleopsis dalmanni]|uniref:uncharacterized protein LOC119679861 isoform X2 n=1 Tax=Teleopsis dalmanni TaxID=139649 RepID=UPI0018CF8B00|nr:uncharacterized protein LOC119679861 isoform X2 [Teleopsis dalmanni]
MSCSEDSDPDWKTSKSKTSEKVAIKREVFQSSNSKTKYQQRFCDKWLNIFDPWLTRCDDDPNKPFCRACQCRLDCNRCHLQRHERTTKHARNLEILINKGEGAARQNLSIRQERSKYYQQRKKLNFSGQSFQQSDADLDANDYIDDTVELENETSFHFVQTEGTPIGYPNEPFMKHENLSSDEARVPLTDGFKNQNVPKQGIKKERMKLLMQIQKDKDELMNSYRELIGSHTHQSSSPHREKNHVELFFDSVSSTVQSFSPKLIAEAKMRISQLLYDLEVRNSNETQNGSLIKTSNGATVVLPDCNSVEGSYLVTSPLVMHSSQHQEDDNEFEAIS